MAINIDTGEAYYNGLMAWQKRDYINSRYWFKISIKNPKFHNDSLMKLIYIETKEGKYLQARQMLRENSGSIEAKRGYGLLENIENNFEQSKKYYSECMSKPNFQYGSLLALSKLYIQTGDYEIAKKMLETLLLNPQFNIQALFGLAGLYMLERNFYEAQRIINEIDISKLTSKLKIHYRHNSYYIKYFLGQLRTSESKFASKDDYLLRRLFNHSDDFLLKHIDKHCDQKIRDTYGCFFTNTDTRELLYHAKEKIKEMNANHFEISDIYRFKLDKPIGYMGDLMTSDLCVVTILGTKDIITMYPVLLSDEFDKENLATSKELKLKRIQGGIKNDR